MSKFLLLAGAAAMAAAAPAIGKGGPGGGHGGGNGGGHAMTHVTMGPSTHANGHATTHAARGPRVHANGHAYASGKQGPVGYGVGGCPPGLAKKAVPCVPPGQAKKQFGVGEQVPSGYNLLSYGALPRTIRSQHSLSSRGRYVYNNGYVYQVSPHTRTVTRVVRTR